MEEKGTFEKLPKKEVVNLVRKRDRLENLLGGIKEMRELPQAVFIVDPKKEINAIREARILKIPVFGIVDTNCDPDDVDYIIPANDDAIRAVKLILKVMGDAILEGQSAASDNAKETLEPKEQQTRRVKQTKAYQTHQHEEEKPKAVKEEKVETLKRKPKVLKEEK